VKNYSAEPDPAKDRLTVLDVLIVLAKDKRALFLATLISAVIAAAVSLTMPNEYTSKAVLLSPVEEQSSAQMLMGQLGVPAAVGREIGLANPLEAYVAMLESENLRARVVDKFHLCDVYHVNRRSLAINGLAGRTNLELTKDGTVAIEYRDRDPRRAQEITAAYVDELRDVMHDLSSGEAAERREFFDRQLNAEKAELDKAEGQLRDTQARTGVLQLDLQAKAVVEEEAQLRAEVAAKELQIASLRSYATENNPSLSQAESELESMRSQLDAAESKVQSPEGDLLIAASKMPQAGMEYLRALRDVNYHQRLQEMLAREDEEARLDEGRQVVFLRVLDQPQVPDHKSGPSRSLIVLAAMIAAMFIVSIWFVTREIDRRIGDDPDRSVKLRLLKSYAMGAKKSGEPAPAQERVL
jgi:uncharacterized protein involved in exopolysaccharide biosynthesis